MKKNIFQTILSLTFFIIFIIPVLAEWQEPANDPPIAGTLKVITISDETQTKQGMLTVSTTGKGNDKGLTIGSSELTLTGNQNLIYGNILSGTGNANLLLLEIGSGNAKFTVDKDGKVIIGNNGELCFQNNDCKSSWAEVGGGYWTQTGNDIYYNQGNGNVGIGTASPEQKLSVA